MKAAIDDKKDTVVIKAVSRVEEGKKKMEKAELKTHSTDTIKYVEKKLVDKGVLRMERHPVDGRKGGIGKPPPKSGHGGKFTWEGPYDEAEIELEAAARPPAIDEKDPNYVDEVMEEKIVKGEEKDVAGLVVGEIEVAKAVEERHGVARVEVDPCLVTDN
uniref:Hyaluronan/mRNA-binding protein domain-containing protein n=1 Tax=Salix viminalis TaxID=40686 RepID=A0A6N2KCU9_SALVM